MFITLRIGVCARCSIHQMLWLIRILSRQREQEQPIVECSKALFVLRAAARAYRRTHPHTSILAPRTSNSCLAPRPEASKSAPPASRASPSLPTLALSLVPSVGPHSLVSKITTSAPARTGSAGPSPAACSTTSPRRASPIRTAPARTDPTSPPHLALPRSSAGRPHAPIHAPIQPYISLPHRPGPGIGPSDPYRGAEPALPRPASPRPRACLRARSCAPPRPTALVVADALPLHGLTVSDRPTRLSRRTAAGQHGSGCDGAARRARAVRDDGWQGRAVTRQGWLVRPLPRRRRPERAPETEDPALADLAFLAASASQPPPSGCGGARGRAPRGHPPARPR
jgi:hypothetical protein